MTTFPEYVEDYLRLRRALGYKLVELCSFTGARWTLGCGGPVVSVASP